MTEEEQLRAETIALRVAVELLRKRALPDTTGLEDEEALGRIASVRIEGENAEAIRITASQIVSRLLS